MPLYDYRCKICENVFSYRHSHKELMVECESCEKETLEKVFGYTSNFVKKAQKSKNARVSVEQEIERVRDELQKVKDRLKNR